MSGLFKFTASLFSKLSSQLVNKSDWTGLRIVAIASITVAGAVLGVRQLNVIQPLELMVLDQLVRSHPDQGTDPRLLVVTITESEIKKAQKWPFPDAVIAQLLEKLQQAQPKVIGIDIYRDIPIEPGHKQLITQLQKPNVISIRNIDTLNGPDAPPEVAVEQVGFNDIVTDPDGIIRRSLFMSGSDSGVLFSFSLLTAFNYLQQQGISPESSQINPDYIQLGKATFLPLNTNSGGYQNIDNQGFQLLLNYRSPKNIARQVALSQVLAGNVNPEWIKDKIVLIGTTAESLKDNFYTPYSSSETKNAKMPGVLIHAQMVSQFLDAASGDRPLFRFWSESLEMLWIIAWIIIGSSLAWRLRHPVVLLVGIGINIAIIYQLCFYLFNQQIWVPTATPILGFTLASSVVITYRSYLAQQQQKMVMKLLGQNTSPQVATALWKGRDHLLKAGKLPGMKVTATMLFSDIKDFSTISEQRTPEALMEWLNELLAMMTHEVLSRDGIINKFTGDGIMAVFGVPMSRQHKREVMEDAQQAVESALAIAQQLEKLNQSWQERGLPVIQMRLGIFTGPVVVGSLGGKDRLEYGVIGDSVNIASRLESCEKERQPNNCRILIGDETLVHLEDLYSVEHWGLLPLKGKQQLVDVYLILGKKPVQLPSDAVTLLPNGEKLKFIKQADIKK